MDIRSFGGWTSPCAPARLSFNVPLLKTLDGTPYDGFGVSVGVRARFYAVEIGDATVIVTVSGYNGEDTLYDFDSAAAFAAIIEAAWPVITSFSFQTR